MTSPTVGVVHLVYPHGPRPSTPDAVGRHLGEALERRYEVAYHDWTDVDTIEPQPGDVLIGHPHPLPSTVFQRSAQRPGWSRVLMLCPFAGDLRQVGFLDTVIPRCDLFLAICGPYWLRAIESSPMAHWRPKLRRLDLAVDRGDFPPIKLAFGDPSRRRLVYIGHQGRYKNVGYLAEIAHRLPGVDFRWIGPGSRPIPGLGNLGWQDFATTEAKALVSTFDFLVTVGSADANPTTILEAMAWGLIPICTPQSGYLGVPGIVNIPLGDPDAAARIIEGWLDRPSEDLSDVQRANWALLDRDYTWDRFADQVFAAIESDESPPLGPQRRVRRAQFLIASARTRGIWQWRAARETGRDAIRAVRDRAAPARRTSRK